MLGSDGPRNYLVLFQNNAEWRSLGGNPGAMALMHTDDGAISLARPRSRPPSFAEYTQVGAAARRRGATQSTANAPAGGCTTSTQVPDFAVTAASRARCGGASTGQRGRRGASSIDPVALSYLLAATGPVTLPTGDVLTSENAVPLLLNEVYLRYENPRDQDAFFACGRGAVFERSRAAPPTRRAVRRSRGRVTSDRLLLWSAHEEDQSRARRHHSCRRTSRDRCDASVSGSTSTTAPGRRWTTHGAMTPLSPGTRARLDAAGTASGVATMTVTLTSNAPADAASLPDLGAPVATFGVPPGTRARLATSTCPKASS